MLSNELLSYAKNLGFGEIYFKVDEANQLYGVIAIHSTQLGPALGGCRFIAYSSIDLAVKDALRLAQGMSYKAALANLPLGGGKTVLMQPQQITGRKLYFQSLGSFVNSLNGRYIIAMDSGVTTTDMDIIALNTPYVVTTSKQGNPAPYTALGVLYGMKAAVKFKFNRDSLKGLHITIQGLGHVGYNLAVRLHKESVRLTVCDRNKKLANHYGKEFGATVVNAEDIYSVECDIFSPCALGAILNGESISQLNTKIVAGAANNQLAELRHAKLLQEKGILYTPDYVINAGGLIHAYTEYRNLCKGVAQQKIRRIYDNLLKIFKQAEEENRLPLQVANSMAEISLATTSVAIAD